MTHNNKRDNKDDFSAGGIVPSGGWALVGEPGPEAVHLPGNSSTYVGIRGYTDRQPASTQPTPDMDGAAYLAMATDDLRGAVHWLTLALKGRSDWQEALGLELDTLRGILAALEQEQVTS